MKRNEWITIIVMMIVIAAIVAYVTGSITGNVVSHNIRIKATDKATYKGVLEMLSQRCYNTPVRADLDNSCEKTCAAGFQISSDKSVKGGIAIGFMTGMYYVASKEDGQKDLEFFSSTAIGGRGSSPMPSCGSDKGINCSRNIEEIMQGERGWNSTTEEISFMQADSSCICCIPESV